MSTLPERLKEVMDELGLKTNVELAEFAGVTKGLVGQWFSGQTGLGKKPLLAFQSKTNYSTQWLVDGTGDKFKVGLDVIPAHKSVDEYPDLIDSETYTAVQRYDVKLSAGAGNFAWIIREEEEPLLFRRAWFKRRGLCADSCKAMYVKGDSMTPVLNNFDTVIIDTLDTELVDGDVYAVLFKESLYIKRIMRTDKGVELISYNEEYRPMLVANGDCDKFQVLGKMVWRGG